MLNQNCGSKNIYSTYRYTYNGMEADHEVSGHGNSYDYEARMYNPRLGRWMKRDPYESKYASLSGYCFVANNPIYFVDPSGKIIEIHGSPGYAAKVMGYLMVLYGTDLGEGILNTLQNSEEVFVITDIYEGLEGGDQWDPDTYNGGGGTIYFDAFAEPEEDDGYMGDQNPLLTLAHEVRHAYDFETKPENKLISTEEYERLAMNFANHIASIMGYENFRTKYYPWYGVAPGYNIDAETDPYRINRAGEKIFLITPPDDVEIHFRKSTVNKYIVNFTKSIDENYTDKPNSMRFEKTKTGKDPQKVRVDIKVKPIKSRPKGQSRLANLFSKIKNRKRRNKEVPKF